MFRYILLLVHALNNQILQSINYYLCWSELRYSNGIGTEVISMYVQCTCACIHTHIENTGMRFGGREGGG